jgi:hypothetical protein
VINISKAELFDVFLCHNSEDKSAVRAISEKLAERNIKPWLDEEQIENIKSVAVFLGESGLGPCQ